MLSISYDSTFNGFLSVVFEIYRQHLDVGEIHPDRSDSPCNLFMQPFQIETSEESAQRLKRAISNQASPEILSTLDAAFRSEEDGIEMKILAYLRKMFLGTDPTYAKNPTSDEMLPIFMTARSVRREVGGMLGMVRFNRMPDGTYFSEIEPKYDILELLGEFIIRRKGKAFDLASRAIKGQQSLREFVDSLLDFGLLLFPFTRR